MECAVGSDSVGLSVLAADIVRLSRFLLFLLVVGRSNDSPLVPASMLRLLLLLTVGGGEAVDDGFGESA